MIESDSLQIFIVTYNRARYLRRTLTQLLAETSPVRNCEIVVLDNHSTDETRDVVKEFAPMRNVTIVTHPRNIGGNANIVRAMELARPNSYVWTLGDDDFYDFANWHEVELAMVRGEKAICLARYILPDERKNDVPSPLVQATFITGMIVHASLYSDTVVSEAYNAVHTLFPQMIPILSWVNRGGALFIVDRPVVFNGDDGCGEKDISYCRGSDVLEVSPYSREQTWLTGWSMVVASIRDRPLRERSFVSGALFAFRVTNCADAWRKLNRSFLSRFRVKARLPLLAAVAAVAPDEISRQLIPPPFVAQLKVRFKCACYRACARLFSAHREHFEKSLAKWKSYQWQ